MSDFAHPVFEAGAIARYDATIGQSEGLAQSAQPAPKTNFSASDILSDGTVIGFSRAYDLDDTPTKIEVLVPTAAQ